ncbi:MAG: TolB family protein [Longimicrobiales bacterium]
MKNIAVWHNLAGPGLVLALVACGDNITDTGMELPENRGTELQSQIAVEFFTEIAWSPDGSEIYFESPGPPARLFVAALSGGPPRELDGGRDAYFDVTAAPDAVYFTTDLEAGNRSSYRLPLDGGEPVLITDRAPSTLAQLRADGRVLLPSPSGATVVYITAPDSIFTYGVASGTRTFIARACERIVTFSPDGTEILCVTGIGGDGEFVRVNLATHATTATTVLPIAEGFPMVVHWGAAGIRALYQAALGGLSIWENDARTTVFQLPARGGLVIDPRNASWSVDGNRIAYWVHECLRRRGLSTCELGQSILYISELSAERSGYVAVAQGEVNGQFIALSPSAVRVAYTFEDRIYHQTTAIPSQ